jgi:hypothetical protein
MGVAKNPVEACYWAVLGTTKDDLKKAELRNQLRRQLTGEQISAVQKRVEEWKPTAVPTGVPPLLPAGGFKNDR